MNDITDRTAGPVLDPHERPLGEGKRWAILVGFAAIVMAAALSVNHRNDAPATPAPSAAATPGPVTPAPPPQSGG